MILPDKDYKLFHCAMSDMIWLASFLTMREASLVYVPEVKLYILYVDAIPTPVTAKGKTLHGAIYRMRRSLA